MEKLNFDKIVQDFESAVPYVQILDENGKLVNKGLKSSLTDEEMVKLMEDLVWARTLNERFILASKQGRIGVLPPSRGQEASQIASIFALEQEDYMLPTYRDTIPMIKKGARLDHTIAWFSGHVKGYSIDPAAHALYPQVIIAAQYVQAAGIALSYKLDKKDNVALAFIGDGGSSQGDFYEGMNFAGAYDAPAIFIVQNNGFAISVHREKQTKSNTLAQKAAAAGIPGVQVDGMDALAVYEVVKEARNRAIAGKGPTLIETLCYRLCPHTLADDPTRYASKEKEEEWEKKEPLIRLRKFLTEKGLWTEEKEQEIVDRVTVEVNDAIKTINSWPKEKVTDLLKNTMANPTQNIQRDIDRFTVKEAK